MKTGVWFGLLLLIVILIIFPGCTEKTENVMAEEEGMIMLPEPQKDGRVSLEAAISGRRSVRDYSDEALTLAQVGQLCWAAQGITHENNLRSAPSAGALYPLKVYIVAGNVDGLAMGVYVYKPDSHSLAKVRDGDLRGDLSEVALDQPWVRQAAIDIVITGDYDVVGVKYGERGVRYTHLEAGHAAQNICLQCVVLKLGTVTIGAFDDDGVRKVLGFPEEETPLYILPVGNL